MSIVFACTCGKRFRVKDEHAGKKAKCPVCNNILTVPSPQSQPGVAPDGIQNTPLPPAPRSPSALAGGPVTGRDAGKRKRTPFILGICGGAAVVIGLTVVAIVLLASRSSPTEVSSAGPGEAPPSSVGGHGLQERNAQSAPRQVEPGAEPDDGDDAAELEKDTRSEEEKAAEDTARALAPADPESQDNGNAETTQAVAVSQISWDTHLSVHRVRETTSYTEHFVGGTMHTTDTRSKGYTVHRGVAQLTNNGTPSETIRVSVDRETIAALTTLGPYDYYWEITPEEMTGEETVTDGDPLVRLRPLQVILQPGESVSLTVLLGADDMWFKNAEPHQRERLAQIATNCTLVAELEEDQRATDGELSGADTPEQADLVGDPEEVIDEPTYLEVRKNPREYIGRKVTWLSRVVSSQTGTGFLGKSINEYVYVITDEGGALNFDLAFCISGEEPKRTAAAIEADKDPNNFLRVITGTVAGVGKVDDSLRGTLRVPRLSDVTIDVPVE